MKRITIIILFSLALFECHNDDRDEIKRGQEQFFYFAALALYRPNFCEPPQLILEEGQTYNITLEPRKRFWFGYLIKPIDDGNNKKIRLKLNKTVDTAFDYDLVNCTSSIESQATLPIPASETSVEVIYEFSSNFNVSRGFTDFLILKSGTPNITINYVLF